MTDDQKKALRLVADVAVFGGLVWLSMPGRPPLKPILWRTGARGAELVADAATSVMLVCRSQYWKAVRP